ncbi:hypothetical protein AKJ41_02540, partial [candidate division MSBL1 archaeon SCGC-AAA259O05]
MIGVSDFTLCPPLTFEADLQWASADQFQGEIESQGLSDGRPEEESIAAEGSKGEENVRLLLTEKETKNGTEIHPFITNL